MPAKTAIGSHPLEPPEDSMRRTFGVALVLLALTSAGVVGQTQITQASTTSLVLQPGGTPAALTLNGQNLASVSSIRVLLNGAPVSGLSGVVKSALATSIMLELAAALTAPVGSYQIE